MPADNLLLQTPTILTVEAFWNWLVLHPNCILRAGTPDVLLCDDDSFHWSFATEGETLIAQVIVGKRLVGELLIDPERITYVQTFDGDREGEYIFELVTEGETERLASFFFVMAHAFGDEDEVETPRAVH